jgi:hypothetical protein
MQTRFLTATILTLALAGCEGSEDGDDTGTTADSGDTSGSGDTGDTGDTGGSDATYPPCNFDPQPMCDDPFDFCEVFGGGSAPHHCTYACETASDCPQPETGTATVICGGSMDDTCMLDCADAECPDGMSCIGTGANQQDRRCAYNP